MFYFDITLIWYAGIIIFHSKQAPIISKAPQHPLEISAKQKQVPPEISIPCP
jgi:hypothetical protein